MASAFKMRLILLLTVLAVGSSEETQNFSPFSFIKEIIHYLGDSSESFDISVTNKKPTYLQSVPYQRTFPGFPAASYDSPPIPNTSNPAKIENQLPLKYAAKLNKSISTTPVHVSSTSPEIQIQNPSYFVAPSRPESTTERVPDLYSIPGPPYTSLKLSMTPTTTRTTSETSGTPPDDLSSFPFLGFPSLETKVPETRENRQYSSTRREQEASTVPAKFTLSSTSYQDESSLFKPQDSIKQTTKSLREQGESTVPAKSTLSSTSYQDESSVFKPQDSIKQTTKSLREQGVSTVPAKSTLSSTSYQDESSAFKPQDSIKQTTKSLREQGVSTVPAKSTLSSTSYQDVSSALKPQDSIEQTTKPLATSSSPPNTSKQTDDVNSPVKQNISHSPIQTATEKPFRYPYAEESTSEYTFPVKPLYGQANTHLKFRKESLSSGNEFSEEFVAEAPSKIEHIKLNGTTVSRSYTLQTLQNASTKLPNVVYSKMPDTSYRGRGNPEIPVKKQNVNLSEMSQEPSEKEYTSFGDAYSSSETAAESPSEQCEPRQCFRGRCSHQSPTQPRCDPSNFLMHHVHSEGFPNPQASASRPPSPMFVQQRSGDDVAPRPASSHRPEIFLAKEVPSPVPGASAPTLQVFAYPSHSSLPYFDGRPQVAEFEAVPYFIGADGMRQLGGCQTCRRLPQFYPLLPMQPIQPL